MLAASLARRWKFAKSQHEFLPEVGLRYLRPLVGQEEKKLMFRQDSLRLQKSILPPYLLQTML